MTDLLDRIQAGRTAEPEVRYFLSRLRAGEGEEQDADRPVAMMARSFAAYQARKAGRAAEFETVLESLKGALAADAKAAEVVPLDGGDRVACHGAGSVPAPGVIRGRTFSTS